MRLLFIVLVASRRMTCSHIGQWSRSLEQEWDGMACVRGAPNCCLRTKALSHLFKEKEKGFSSALSFSCCFLLPLNNCAGVGKMWPSKYWWSAPHICPS